MPSDVWANLPPGAGPHRRLGRPVGTDSIQTVRRILRAALQCFAEHGFDGATNAQIAETAGVTHGTIYHHFSSKLELFASVATAVTAEVDERFYSAVDPSAGLAVQMRTLIAGLVDLAIEEPLVARFVVVWTLEVRRHPEIGASRSSMLQETLGAYVQVVEAAKSRGELAADTDPIAFGQAVRAMLFGLATLAATEEGDAPTLRATADTLGRLLEGTFLTPTSRKPSA